MRAIRVAAALLVAVIFGFHADAAEPPTNDLLSKLDSSLAAGDWATGDAVAGRIAARYDRVDLAAIPDWMPPFYFKAGWCAMKLERWVEAERLFERGYRTPTASENRYKILSLRGWAEASRKLGKTEQALRLYGRYAEESSAVDWTNPFRMDQPSKR
jgi:tetratricopeptide (TPR) repeat protein